MEFRVLGPLQVRVGGQRLAVGGPQAEKVLATLLRAGGQVASLEALIDALWDGEPPQKAKHQIHKVIAQLRTRLPDAIETDGPGYRIVLAGATLDAATFAELAGSPTIPSLTAALGLWHGSVLAGLDSRALRTWAAALEERRLAVIEELMGLRLADGQAAAVAAELPPVVAADPLREGLRGLLMLALYRSGRQAEALRAYAETRALLAEELGVEPGPQLAQLHRRILSGDAALAAPAREVPAGNALAPSGPAPVAKAPCTLPYDVPDFAGRTRDLRRLFAATTSVMINAIDGMAGIGKTALAVHAAHRLAERYRDGQLFCDLHAHTPGAQPVEPEAALELLLRMLDVPVEAIPEGLDQRAALWRAELAGRRILVVLDNAVSAAQVRPLLPGTPECLALITSRRRLSRVDGASVLSLDVLGPADALELFANVVGVRRAAAEPAAAADVVRLCGYLPLAIRIAATRLAHRPSWTIAFLAHRLRAGAGRLDQLTVEDRGVDAAFALSYACLDPEQQRMFRLLGLHPGADFDAYSAAALADVSPHRADALLETLVDCHLLVNQTAGRYTFHDLLREYARQLGWPQRHEPRARLHDYYLATTAAASDLIIREARRFEPTLSHPPRYRPDFADLDAALAWLEAERTTLVAVTAMTEGWQLACLLREFFEYRGHFADWRATHERALRHAESDPLAATLIEFGLGALAMWTDRPAEGMQHFQRALAGNLDDPRLTAAALTSQGMLAHLLHRDREAAGYLHRALAIDHDNQRITALAWNNLGLTEGRLGNRREAIEYHRRALALAQRIGSLSAERGILLGLGETALRLGVDARQPFGRTLQLARSGRFRMQEALALDGLAHATGDAGYWRAALAILADLGVARADLVRAHLDNPGARCCDLCRAGPSIPAARHEPVAV